MYYLTRQHGDAFPHEVERLWGTVAANKRNVIPILDFLISRGMQEVNLQVAPLSHGWWNYTQKGGGREQCQEVASTVLLTLM
jgi:hypothetical protein